MSIPADVYVTLQKIILFAQKEQLYIMRNGRGLEQTPLPDEPDPTDLDIPAQDTVVAPSAAPTAPKLIHVDEALPAPQIKQLPPASSSAPQSQQSIKDLVDSYDDKQMSMEEILQHAEQPAATQAATPAPVAQAESSQPKVQEARAAASNTDAQDGEDLKDDDLKYTRKKRFHDKRAARREWLIEKWRKEYEYSCKRQAIKDLCYGYQRIVSYVEDLMHEWDAVAADDNIENVSNITLNGIDDKIGG